MALGKTINLAPTTEESSSYQTSNTISTRDFKVLRRKVDDNKNTLQAEISVNADEIALKASKTYVDGSDATLQSQITVQAGEITLKASKTYVDTSDAALQSQITVNANAITLKASQTSLNTTNTNVSNLTTRVTTAEATLVVQAGQIATKVSTTDLTTTLEDYSTITQTSDAIATRVATTDYNGNKIASLINQTATTIQISASKLDIDAYVTFTNLETAGETTINGGNIITSSISADKLSVSSLSAISANVGTLTTGTIGNWTVGSNLTRNGITLGNDAITFTNNGTGGSTINFNNAKIYNNSGSSAIGVSGNFLVDSNLYVLGTAIVDDIRPSTSGIDLGASGYRWGMLYADGLWCNTVGSSTLAAERPNVYAGTIGATFSGKFYYLTRDSNGFVKAV